MKIKQCVHTGAKGYTRITEIEIGINLVEGWYYLKYLPDW
jgi:hypothetical protein